MRNRPLMAILTGGLVAGTIDIGSPALIYGISPIVILRAIASGVLGKESYSGGAYSAALGLVLQWAMSLLIAAIFVVPATRYRVLIRHWITAGIAYGVVVFFVMNYVVVPLSRTPPGHGFTVYTFTTNMLAMLLFGLIIAFFANRYIGGRSTK